MSTSTRIRTWSQIDSSSNSEPAGDGPKQKKQKLNPDLQMPPEIMQIQESATLDHCYGAGINLPPEIVLQIFEFLPRIDLLSASLVCTLWQQVSKDESIHWHTLFNLKLIEDGVASTEANSPAVLDLLPEASRQNFSKDWRRAGLLQEVLDADRIRTIVPPLAIGRTILCLILNEYDPLLVVPTRGVLPFDLELDFHPSFYRADVKLSKDATNPGTITVEVNPKRIEHALRNGEHENVTSQLAKCLAMQTILHLKSQAILPIFKNATPYLPAALPTLFEQPNELIGVKLHNYQLKALNWMLSTETSEQTYAVSPLYEIHPSLHLLVERERFQLVPSSSVSDYDVKIKPKGGVLADEMGLGKTVAMIGLILTNPMKEQPVNEPYFTTKATLVFCPNHLVQQWKKEIETHCSKKLKIVVLTTIVQVKKFSYQDVMDADVVIASYNLLQNKNYIAFPDNPKDFVVGKPSKSDCSDLGIMCEPAISDLLAFKRVARVDNLLQELKDKDPKTIKGVILDHFHWHRVIMDEGHEVINDKSIGRFSILRYQKTYAWYMTGTPFPTTLAMHNARQLVGFVGPEPKQYDPNDNDFWGFEEYYKKDYQLNDNWIYGKPATTRHFDHLLNKLFTENLVWRNTKVNIEDEYKMAEVTENFKILNFTQIERAVYDDLVAYPPSSYIAEKYERERKRKEPKLSPQTELCLDLNDQWGKNLTEIKEFFIEKKNKDTANFEDDLQKLTDKREQERYEMTETAIYNARVFPEKRDKILQEIAKCQQIKKMLEDALPINPSNNDSCLEAYIERHGTKLGNLVDLLKTIFAKNPSTGVIIFSQFGPYLRKIAQVLTEYDIPSCFVEGNVFTKTNAMTKFKNKEVQVKVILMNIKKTASGANLIEASHVMFMEPLVGRTGYIRATEKQAIGRAQRQGQTEPVTVTRFLVKDTVEHTSYLQHYGTNTPNNSDTTINQAPGKGTLVRSGSFSVNITKCQNKDEDGTKSDNVSSVDSMQGVNDCNNLSSAKDS